MKNNIKNLFIGLLLILSLLVMSSRGNVPQQTAPQVLPDISEEQMANTEEEAESQAVIEEFESLQVNEPEVTPAPDDIPPAPVEALPKDENAVSQDADIIPAETKKFCTLSVKCDTILNNISLLKEEKRSLIPADGIIYAKKEVEFFDNESVFDVLLREMRNSGIHLEFESTPAYNSVYIEGIANIYEFDCGDMSGWKYKVNGTSPSRGCSQHIVTEGDRIEFYFACNLME